MLRAKDFAKKYLTETIETKVKSTTESRYAESGMGKKSSVSSSYKSNVLSFTEKNLVGLQTDYFVNEREKTVYAFAYLKKDDLFTFYKARIEKNLSAVENKIALINQAGDEGEKPKAIKIRMEAKDLLPAIQNDEDVLIAANSVKSAAVSAKINQVTKELENLDLILNKSIRIYVQTDESLFGKKIDILSNKLCKELSTENCSIVTKEEDADYTLVVSVKTRKADFQSEFKYSYADVTYELKNKKTGRILLKDGFAYKGGGVSHEKAAYDALVRSSAKIYDQIKNELFDN